MSKKIGLYPKVSIIIPCRNEEQYIRKNLDAILEQDYEGVIEVLVVDGMSSDNTREIVKSFASDQIRLIDNPHQYTPNALNIGVANTSGEVFIILGGHAYINQDFVRKNIEVLQRDEKVGCAGGQILNIHENHTSEIISRAMASSFGVGNATFRVGGEAGYVDTVAFGAYRKKIHDEIGGFDEDLVRNQDDEYNFKVTKAGYKIYFDPEIISNYYVRGSIIKLYRQYYQYGYWKVYVNKKHKTVTTWRQLVPLVFVLGIFIGLVGTIIIPGFIWIYLFGLVSYAFLAIMSGISAGRNFKEAFQVAAVFPVLHFSYGLGYLVGIIEFILFNKKPSNRSKSSTRD